MTTSSKRRSRLSDADLVKLLALVKDADSVELKLTVPDSERRSTVTALGMDPLEARIRQVYFFDTPELACNRHGVVVRARRVQQRGDDSVVKLRRSFPTSSRPTFAGPRVWSWRSTPCPAAMSARRR